MAAPTKSPMKIDVHHHFLPQIYYEALEAHGGDPSGFPTPPWSAPASLDLMDTTSTSHTILSLTSPGVQVAPLEKQASLARAINDHAATLCAQHPQRFSFFAAVPSPLSPTTCIAEITHAMDVLGARGVTLFTSYTDAPGGVNDDGTRADGTHADDVKICYLGHAALRPVWAELNARKAVVFVHPTRDAARTGRALISPLLPSPFIDYPHETARSAMDMLTAGTKRDFADCRVILSHAGGTLPLLLFRAAPGVEMVSRARVKAGVPESAVVSAAQLIEGAKSFYYDLALSSSKNVLDTLLRNFPTDHVLYGSDFPYAPRPAIESLAHQLDDYELDDEIREDIYWRNASRLFPDFKIEK